MIHERTKVWGHRLLSAGGVLTVFYCLAVLGFVATRAPDVGLRCLLVNDPHGKRGCRRHRARDPANCLRFGERSREGTAAGRQAAGNRP